MTDLSETDLERRLQRLEERVLSSSSEGADLPALAPIDAATLGGVDAADYGHNPLAGALDANGEAIKEFRTLSYQKEDSWSEPPRLYVPTGGANEGEILAYDKAGNSTVIT